MCSIYFLNAIYEYVYITELKHLTSGVHMHWFLKVSSRFISDIVMIEIIQRVKKKHSDT